MAVKIRLQRKGRTKAPYYHIVIADARAPRDGKYIERIGSYNPMTKPATIDIDRDAAYTWLTKGAQPTDTVRAILRFKGVLVKKHLMRGVAKGAMTIEEADVKLQEWIDAKDAKIAQRISGTKEETKAKQKAISGQAKIKPVVVEATAEEAVTEEPAEEATPVAEAPAAEENQETPAVEEPAADEAPVVEEAPAAEEAPAVEEAPVVEDAAIATEEAPVAEETPLAEEVETPVEETPVTEDVVAETATETEVEAEPEADTTEEEKA